MGVPWCVVAAANPPQLASVIPSVTRTSWLRITCLQGAHERSAHWHIAQRRLRSFDLRSAVVGARCIGLCACCLCACCLFLVRIPNLRQLASAVAFEFDS